MPRWRFLELLNFIATELHKGFSPLFKQPTAEARETTIKALGQRLGLLAGQLADRSYLTGKRFTIADAYAYVMLTWTGMHRMDISAWPSLQAYMERVEERPAVQQARREEGLEAQGEPRGAPSASPQDSRPSR